MGKTEGGRGDLRAGYPGWLMYFVMVDVVAVCHDTLPPLSRKSSAGTSGVPTVKAEWGSARSGGTVNHGVRSLLLRLRRRYDLVWSA